jgi:hypothetical protein
MESDLRFQSLTPRMDSNGAIPTSSSHRSVYETAKSAILSPIGAAILISILCFILLATIQPPFVKTVNPESHIKETEISWTAIFVWAAIVFLMVLLIPPIGSYCYANYGSAAMPAGMPVAHSMPR